MKVSRIKISNILGITDLEFDAGKFVEISGQNGQGKSSVLEAIKSIIKGGHDVTLLRNGAKRGEIAILLDDGTEIVKKVRGETSTTEVRKDGKAAQRPVEIIRALTDALSVNPVEFLSAPKKDRMNILLEAMPIALDPARLRQISGVPVKAEEGVHALHIIDAARKQVYDDRTGTNRAVKEKEATINQVRSAMPDAPEGDGGDEDELTRQAEAVRTAERTELARISTKIEGVRAEHQKKLDRILDLRNEATGKIVAERDAKIATLQKQIDEERAVAQTMIDATKAQAHNTTDAETDAFDEIKGKAATQRERTIQKAAADLEPVNAALASLRTNRSAIAKREQAQETVKRMETELETLIADAGKQSAALEAIDAYKAELLATTPIKGLEMRDGEVYFEGVAFDRVNTAQKVKLAVEVAKLRSGKLGLCCVDGIECLDSDAFAQFRTQAVASGLQLFVSRVSDQPGLHVSSGLEG